MVNKFFRVRNVVFSLDHVVAVEFRGATAVVYLSGAADYEIPADEAECVARCVYDNPAEIATAKSFTGRITPLEYS